MRHQLFNLTAAALVAMTLMAGCETGSNSTPVVMPAPPPPPAAKSFNQFVVDQFAATADDTKPIAVDDEEFAFDEGPSAFDSLLQ